MSCSQPPRVTSTVSEARPGKLPTFLCLRSGFRDVQRQLLTISLVSKAVLISQRVCFLPVLFFFCMNCIELTCFQK